MSHKLHRSTLLWREQTPPRQVGAEPVGHKLVPSPFSAHVKLWRGSWPALEAVLHVDNLERVQRTMRQQATKRFSRLVNVRGQQFSLRQT